MGGPRAGELQINQPAPNIDRDQPSQAPTTVQTSLPHQFPRRLALPRTRCSLELLPGTSSEGVGLPPVTRPHAAPAPITGAALCSSLGRGSSLPRSGQKRRARTRNPRAQELIWGACRGPSSERRRGPQKERHRKPRTFGLPRLQAGLLGMERVYRAKGPVSYPLCSRL